MNSAEPDREQDRPERPASDSLMLHIVDEMPARVIWAVTFVAFFFFWGAVNNILKLFIREPDVVDFRYGLVAGSFAAVLTPIILWRIKRRKK